jgi:exonuclease SbcD
MSHRSFTFLHAADLHLDSPLLGLTRYPGAPVDRLRNATRDAFRELVDEALQRAVDFVVLAGDVFDGDWPDYASGLWFAAQLRRLTEAGVLVYLLYGNHDAESRMTSKLRLPPGVHAFGSAAPESFEVPGFDVVLHGQSFADPCVETNLVKDYPPARAGVFNLGVLHTGLEGYEGHGRYAPCSLADLVAKGYDYWALGHVHKRQVVSQDPWIVFPGNLQGRHARELGPKGASFVRVQDGAVASVEEFACDVARWAHVEVDLDGVDDEGTALRRLEDALRDAYSGRCRAPRRCACHAARRDSARSGAARRAAPDRGRGAQHRVDGRRRPVDREGPCTGRTRRGGRTSVRTASRRSPRVSRRAPSTPRRPRSSRAISRPTSPRCWASTRGRPSWRAVGDAARLPRRVARRLDGGWHRVRFRSLELVRFGAFEGLVLPFRDGARLHVVHGPNGAGKSTTLDALRSVLFGIQPRTPQLPFRVQHAAPAGAHRSQRRRGAPVRATHRAPAAHLGRRRHFAAGRGGARALRRTPRSPAVRDPVRAGPSDDGGGRRGPAPGPRRDRACALRRRSGRTTSDPGHHPARGRAARAPRARGTQYAHRRAHGPAQGTADEAAERNALVHGPRSREARARQRK